MTFSRALRFVFNPNIEGGYVDHPLDRGGATNFGITQSTYSVWLAKHGKPLQPVKFITRDEAEQIYREEYWLLGRCEQMPEEVGVVHFDASVNHGVHKAATLIQECVGTTPDGVIGPKTLGAIRKSLPLLLAEQYIARRRRFYKEIVEALPSQEIFLKGWLARMDHLTKEIHHA